MNALNRIITILVLLLLLVLVVPLAIAPVPTLQWMQEMLARFETFLTEAEALHGWVFILGRIAALIAAVVVLITLIWREVRPRRVRSAKLETNLGSRGTVSLDSVAHRLAWHIDQLADVISVDPRVVSRGRSVDIVLNLETSPDTDVPMKTDEVVALTREILTDHMGLEVGRVVVNMRHAEHEDESWS